MEINLEKYVTFVNATASDASKDYEAFVGRLEALEQHGFSTQRVLNAAIGMSAEAGEFIEIVKKIIFQGKEITEENKTHLKRELGDILWYVAQACIGLNIGLSEVLEMNVDKLSARYPNGFAVARSENREKGDV